MDVVSALATYFVLWWMVLFTVLPWGNRADPAPQTGTVTSAPLKPRLRLKFLVTSGISAIIWVVVFYLIKYDIIDFRAIAAAMMHEDKVT